MLEPTRSLWLLLDDRVFFALNRSLADHEGWQIFWALTNNRAFDTVSAICVSALFLHYGYGAGRESAVRITSIYLMAIVLVIAGIQIGKALPVDRLSPTLLHAGSLRLSELVTWIPTKDASGDCFPGDHATALLVCAGLISFYFPRSYAVTAWAIAIAFSVPRIVGGAHWLSDDLVGAVAIAGVVLSCVLATPLHAMLTERLRHLADKLLPR